MARSKEKLCFVDRDSIRSSGRFRSHIVVFLLLGPTGFAQTATITGTVADVYGETLANATIQATNLATKATFRTQSSATGAYALPQLPRGTYTLFVNVPGMVGYRQQGIVLSADQTMHLDVRVLDSVNLNTLGDGREQNATRQVLHPTPAGPTPRTADGKPDLSGMWYAPRTIDFGPTEPLPWVQALMKERAENQLKDWPLTRCLPLGVTLFASRDFYRVIQTPTHFFILSENDVPNYRQFFLDGRSHPKNLDPTWMAHSVGKWEGDTLVVDTVGFNDKTWNPDMSSPTEKMHVTERFRRPDLGHLEIELTIVDPGAYAKPWTIKRISDLAPDEEVQEFICTENNRDVEHMVGK